MGRKRTVNLNLPDNVKLEFGTYYYRLGSRPRVRLGRTWPEAMQAYAKLMITPARDSRLLSAVMDKYMREIAPKKAPRTYTDNATEIVMLRAVFGDVEPDDVTTPMVNQYAAQRVKQNGTPAVTRANRELALLSHIFTCAINWGNATRNPCKGRFKEREAKRTHVPTDTDIDWFKANASDLCRLYLDFKYLTSLRVSDILKIQLSDLTDDGIVFVEGKKMKRNISTMQMEGKAVLIAWTPELRDVVAQVRALRTRGSGRPAVFSRHLFCTQEGKAFTRDGFAANWNHSMDRAIAKAGEEGVAFTRFRDHDVRAKSATDEPLTAQKRLQHTSAKMTQTYIRSKERVTVTPITSRRKA